MESPVPQVKVYSIQVSNISCINCANTIKNALAQLEDPLAKVTVDIMSEKLTLTASQPHTLPRALEILRGTKFQPLGSPVLLSGNAANERSVTFLLKKGASCAEVEALGRGIVGVVSLSVREEEGQLRVEVSYDSEVVKGRDIADVLERVDADYRVRNEKVEGLAARRREVVSEHSMGQTVLLVCYFLLVNMVLPVLPLTADFYRSCVTFPSQLGIYSFSVIFNILLTGYVMKHYAKGFIVRAYRNYLDYKTTNMETLIALGSLSACFLFLFFMVRYSIENYNDSLHGIHMAIMDITDALTSASIIVLVVTIGKNL
jgi:cation transport ATPase